MRYIATTLAVMLALGLSSCSGDENKNAAKEKEAKPVVKVESVTERMVPQVVDYTASVEADEVNNISSSMPNRIRAIYVDEGQRVAKGQRLVQLDDVNTTTYQIQVDNAKANLANVQLEYNRAVELLKIGGGTQQAVDQMRTQLTNAQNAVKTAQTALRNASENTVLTSPANGVVTARNYDPGDMTGSLPILTVSTIHPVKLVINVSENDLSRVKAGMPAVVTFDTYGDEKFEGRVSKILPTVDARSRTFGVEISMPNGNDKLLPGMFGRVTLNLGEANHVLVPDKAVVKQPGSGDHYVYVYKDGKVSYNKVELGQRLDDTYEIISGVPNGAQVVVNGQSRLANGMAVEVKK